MIAISSLFTKADNGALLSGPGRYKTWKMLGKGLIIAIMGNQFQKLILYIVTKVNNKLCMLEIANKVFQLSSCKAKINCVS